MHNMSVEKIINQTSLTELTQEKMIRSPGFVNKLASPSDVTAHKKSIM